MCSIDQQRLLAGAKVDPKAAAEVKTARSTSSTAKGRSSRKRKGSAATNGTDGEGVVVKNESETETEGVPTPQPSDSEDEDDAAFETGLPTREQQAGSREEDHQDRAGPAPTGLPPRRDLPFGGSSSKEPAKTSQDTTMKDAQVDEDDDTTDDEL